MAEYLALVFCLIVLAIPCHGKSFSATPKQIEMCGNTRTQSLTLSCRPTVPHITQVFAIEIGKLTSGNKSAISRITVVDPYTVMDVSTEYPSRLNHSGSINGQTGTLDLRFTNLQDSDAATYYCYISFLTDEVGEEHSSEVVTLHNLRGQVPSCTKDQVENALVQHVPVNSSKAGKCPNGIAGRSEALLIKFCSGPDISSWGSGIKVMDMCCQIPKYTPVATFEFGLYVQDERGMSGVFLECTSDGFTMATQLCGHYPITVPLKKGGSSGYISNADNYYIVNFNGSSTPVFG